MQSFEDQMNQVLVKWEKQLQHHQDNLQDFKLQLEEAEDADARRIIRDNINIITSREVILQEMVNDLKAVLGKQ
jgi:hypothetical protein